MGKAKDILLQPIEPKIANKFVKRVHYSGKVVQNSQLHIGVFYKGVLHGAMQFGPSLDKRKIMGLVTGMGWNEFIELNRLAFDDVLPRNSESRAIAIAMKLLKKHAPQIKWVISFADATQCGDGTIYRASGFVLTGIKENSQSWRIPNGDEIRRLKLFDKQDYRWLALASYADNFNSIHTMFIQGGTRNSAQQKAIRDLYRTLLNGRQSMKDFIRIIGGMPFDGFQLRYIYFIDPTYRQHLTVPEVPFSKIAEMGATMYKGIKRDLCGLGEIDNAAHSNAQTGGASPTSPLTSTPTLASGQGA